MADHGAGAARRAGMINGPVENIAVDIAGNVDNQIDVDSDSSSDNELLEEVVRAPHGRQDHRQLLPHWQCIRDYGLTWLT